MSIDILMPALSPTMEEGTLAKWLVKAGDKVSCGDVIAEIETDKATMEVEAVDEGVVDELLVPEGTEEVKVNTPIARMKGEGAAAGGPQSSASQPAAPPQAGEQEQSSPQGQSGGRRAEPRAISDDAYGVSRSKASISPLARRLAALAGIDLAGVTGSGAHGRIVRRDIEVVKGRGLETVVQPIPAPSPIVREPSRREPLAAPTGSYDLIPLDGMRRTIARRMTDSFRDVPHFPLVIDLEIDALLAARAHINAILEQDGNKVSINDMLIKAVAVGLKRTPEANASYMPEGIALHHHADVAIAVAIDGGLIAPIIRAAETKGLAQIAVESRDLAERARTKELRPEEFQGGTFTVSNLGMFGIKSFNSIINEPQGAILSVGAAERRPVVRGDELAIATVMTVTLTCDHRAIDGVVGARFLSVFSGMIAEPMMMLV